MSIVCFELKKLWNWRTLLLLVILCVMTWIAFLSEFAGSYESLLSHGIYGSYQTELFRQYGDTLEAEELVDFNIPDQKDILAKEMDTMIVKNSIFFHHGIQSYEEYSAFTEDENARNALGEQYYSIISDMEAILEEQKEGQTLDEWYDSPLMRYNHLVNLENRYVNYERELNPLINNGLEQPTVIKTAQRLMDTKNANLIPYFLCNDFSLYAAVIGVIASLSTLFFVSPLVVIDRAQNIHMLQYAASVGRGILKKQFAATIGSAFVLSGIIVAGAYLPLLAAFSDNYWSAPIMAYDGITQIQLYNITFGNYVLILAAISVVFCVGMAGIAFVLARFSSNIVTLLIKIVPICGMSAAVMFILLRGAMSYSWLSFNVFRGKLDIPEVWITCFFALLGILLSAVTIHRERRVEVM